MLGCAHKSVSAKNKKNDIWTVLYPTEQCQTVERLDVELCGAVASPPTIHRAQSQKSLFASDFALKYLLTFSSEETRRLKSLAYKDRGAEFEPSTLRLPSVVQSPSYLTRSSPLFANLSFEFWD